MPAGHDISVGSDRYVRVAALEIDAPSNSTTTGVEIAGLQIPNVEPGVYIAEWFIVYQSAAATTGVKFGVNHTGTATMTTTLIWGTTGGAATTNAPDQVSTGNQMVEHASSRSKTTTAPDLGPSASVDTLAADMLAYIYSALRVTAIGDLELWHASEVAAASTVKAGSCLRLTKCA